MTLKIQGDDNPNLKNFIMGIIGGHLSEFKFCPAKQHLDSVT